MNKVWGRPSNFNEIEFSRFQTTVHLKEPVTETNKIGFPTLAEIIVIFHNPNSSFLGNLTHTHLLGKTGIYFLYLPSPSKYLGYIIMSFSNEGREELQK